MIDWADQNIRNRIPLTPTQEMARAAIFLSALTFFLGLALGLVLGQL